MDAANVQGELSGGMFWGNKLSKGNVWGKCSRVTSGVEVSEGNIQDKMSKGISGGVVIAGRKFPDSHADSRVVVTVCDTVVNTHTHTRAHTDSF